MVYIRRLIQSRIAGVLSREKSILLLGPRQTGKTTLLDHQVHADLNYSFLETDVRRRFEMDPMTLIKEIKGFIKIHPSSTMPTVLVDEIQKVPSIMDVIQLAIDKKLAKFVLTGSSARKLRRDHQEINLLPGRVIALHLDALSLLEIPNELPEIEELLINGSLPEIVLQGDPQSKEELLVSYVNVYLEQEIRAEAVVRNLASFSRFLTYAAVDAGHQVNFNNLSQEIGVTRQTVGEYYQILEDCLIADRIDPITNVNTRRRLTKAPKYLFFDLGVRRISAGEGLRLPAKHLGDLFEQFVGIELLKLIRIYASQAKLHYWRDHSGPEVDYVIEFNRQYLPIEVKWTTRPSKDDAKHITTFMKEYDCSTPAFIVCRVPQTMELSDNVFAISWRTMPGIIRDYLQGS